MTRCKYIALLLPLLAPSLPASALQILDVKDGETVLAKISQKEITRIAFEQSRIRKVTGNAGEFVLEKDDERGQVFIRPAQAESSKPINVFVSSERTTVALLLQPVDGPSDTLLIREPRKASTPLARAGKTQVHVRELKHLLLAMAGEATAEGVEVRDTPRELALRPGVGLTLQRTYLNAGLVGERYQLMNDSGGALSVSEADLGKPGVLAVSIEQRQLNAGETTRLFVLRERRAHE